MKGLVIFMLVIMIISNIFAQQTGRLEFLSEKQVLACGLRVCPNGPNDCGGCWGCYLGICINL